MTHGSYLLIEPGMTVYAADSTAVGTVTELVADENADIFRGIVFTLSGTASSNESVFLPGEHITAVEPEKVLTDLAPDGAARLSAVAPSTNA